ncbi:hypothetical protein RHMOL_Rhmol11G0037600 [Rhododendron molle]|uniref:Uncharacterized protein n=1 Tax=Rhododendron molle TaxID=49168 RepID=A0ACC0LNT6_RHOML|nr:hypothetical protein RHMOL_Rhmol11G0037600 [Rhododendron molle]
MESIKHVGSFQPRGTTKHRRWRHRLDLEMQECRNISDKATLARQALGTEVEVGM